MLCNSESSRRLRFLPAPTLRFNLRQTRKFRFGSPAVSRFRRHQRAAPAFGFELKWRSRSDRIGVDIKDCARCVCA